MFEEEVATSQILLLEIVYYVAAEDGFTGSYISSKPKDRPTTRPWCMPGGIETLGRQPFAGAGNVNIF